MIAVDVKVVVVAVVVVEPVLSAGVVEEVPLPHLNREVVVLIAAVPAVMWEVARGFLLAAVLMFPKYHIMPVVQHSMITTKYWMTKVVFGTTVSIVRQEIRDRVQEYGMSLKLMRRQERLFGPGKKCMIVQGEL